MTAAPPGLLVRLPGDPVDQEGEHDAREERLEVGRDVRRDEHVRLGL